METSSILRYTTNRPKTSELEKLTSNRPASPRVHHRLRASLLAGKRPLLKQRPSLIPPY
jgi:hypothetical protein